MLHSGKPALFALFSVVVHILFVVLFAQVTLSFTPPPVKQLSLVLMSSGGGQSDIVQKEAVWISPKRIEPAFPVDAVLSELESEVPKWRHLAKPEDALFTLKETLLPVVDVKETADKLRPRPPDKLFAAPPAESKPMPTAEFALGPDLPRILHED
ncbi:MAG: hypothetical protein C4520_16410 [Candidatus Abyssobacteria bacterium SURF_5]|uniref:Uncharacterized protein n=1 Tax=Abyssobacteria bacterium (strain SURF_5) TaxID=2093360 RepID=A0A3A4NGT0_ABYX5|nr:MAG: hypothetical protein C4520_16410 [Candidatus Abyssubacteria bacterium SURF_5]